MRAESVARQAQRLSTLADDLLGLGRLDAAIPVKVEPVDLAELAHTLAAARPSPRPMPGNVVLQVESYGSAWALGDPLAVARIIRALLDNALRHGAPPDTALTVTVTTDGETRRGRRRATPAPASPKPTPSASSAASNAPPPAAPTASASASPSPAASPAA